MMRQNFKSNRAETILAIAFTTFGAKMAMALLLKSYQVVPELRPKVGDGMKG